MVDLAGAGVVYIPSVIELIEVEAINAGWVKGLLGTNLALFCWYPTTPLFCWE